MTIVLALVGLLIGGSLGAASGALGGALAGAALGYSVGVHLAFRRRIEFLEHEVARLASERDLRDAPPPVERPWLRSAAPTWSPPPAAQTPPKPVAVPPAPAPAPIPESELPPYLDPYERAPAKPAADTVAEREQALFGAARRPPAAPPPGADWVGWIRDYFAGGNLVVRSGIIVLFFGVAFLLKFAADRHLLPIEFRLAGVALGGVALLVIGWRLRERQRAYGLALQGGGVGLLYLTVFAAFRLYSLLPPSLAFALLVVVAALSAFLAIGQNSMALAALGATGGFLAPVLASTGQGNHVVLFSYYALLDAGIVAIAWFKTWRPLNLLAFVFTYAIGTAWGVLKYAPENFATTEPFVWLYFAMFVTVAILFARRRAPDLKDTVDGTLVFGTPVMTMVLQSALVHERPYAMAFSALGLAGVYLALAAGAWRWRREELRLLAAAFLALSVAFLTLAVPLALDGHWTAATWALEGAAILWIGLRQERSLAIASGVLLQLGAASSFVVHHDVLPASLPLINSAFLGALFIAIAGLASAHALRTQPRVGNEWRWASIPPVWWSLLWWAVAGIGEIDRSVPPDLEWAALLGFATLTGLGCAALSRWRDWREFEWPALLLLPAMFIAAAAFLDRGHFLVGGGGGAWPLAIAAWIWLLRDHERYGKPGLDVPLHVATLWLLVALASIEAVWQVRGARLAAPAWHYAMSAVPALLALWAVGAARRRWPLREFPLAYSGIGAAGLALYLALWTFLANLADGGAAPLPYLPLVNPVELAQTLSLVVIAGWLLFLHREAPAEWRSADVMPATWPLFSFLAFALSTAVLLRVVHHAADIEYDAATLMRSTTVQASLSIFWGTIALASMVAGARLGRRFVWFTGAGLLGVVLAKMFLVDLSRTATVARIVSFIGVGILMLVIGRFSPVPPADRAGESPR